MTYFSMCIISAVGQHITHRPMYLYGASVDAIVAWL